jgi:hypothetical protein
MESLSPTGTVTALETRSELANFTQNHQNIEKSPISTQKPSEPLVSGCFNWADDTDSSPLPTGIITGLRTCSASTGFMEKHQKVKKRSVFSQNSPKPLPAPSTTPTKYPRNLSCLRSTSTHPFSLLRCRRCHPKWQQNNQCHHSHSCWHYPQHYPSYPQKKTPRTDWDQDPRLADLSSVLQALSWVRR